MTAEKEVPNGLAFFVDTTPYCLWDGQNAAIAKNREIALGLRPDYFSYQAAHVAKGLESNALESSAASMALRVIYGHAAETAIALLFGSIQAGNCLPAWLDLYGIGDLVSLCKKIETAEPFPTMMVDPPRSWHDFATQVFRDAPSTIKSVDGTQEVEKEVVIAGVAKAISHLSADLCDADARLEYNSYKHGLRVVPAGLNATVVPKSDRTIEIPGSRFGSVLLTTNRVAKRDRINITYELRATNFDPRILLRRIFVAVACLECLKVFLVQEVSKGRTPVAWRVFPSEAHYTSPWEDGPRLRSARFGSLNLPEDFPLATADEVRLLYERARIKL